MVTVDQEDLDLLRSDPQIREYGKTIGRLLARILVDLLSATSQCREQSNFDHCHTSLSKDPVIFNGSAPHDLPLCGALSTNAGLHLPCYSYYSSYYRPSLAFLSAVGKAPSQPRSS